MSKTAREKRQRRCSCCSLVFAFGQCLPFSVLSCLLCERLSTISSRIALCATNNSLSSFTLRALSSVSTLYSTIQLASYNSAIHLHSNIPTVSYSQYFIVKPLLSTRDSTRAIFNFTQDLQCGVNEMMSGESSLNLVPSNKKTVGATKMTKSEREREKLVRKRAHMKRG